MGKMFFLYCVSIVLVNIGFDKVPLIDLGFGFFSPMAVIVGLIFVLRDYAQRECGHKVLLAMAFGCGISFWFASPIVAVASVVSFAVSEFIDYAVYTFLKQPFSKRILTSSLIAVPIDSIIFLSMIGSNTPTTFILMVASKLLAAVGIYYYVKRKGSESSPEASAVR